MLFSIVYTEAHPRRSAARAAFCTSSIPSNSFSRTPAPMQSAVPQNRFITPLESTLVEVLILGNLRLFRINTYEKRRGVGVLLLTTHPMRMRILPAPSISGSERSESIPDSDSVGKDLSSHQRKGLRPEPVHIGGLLPDTPGAGGIESAELPLNRYNGSMPDSPKQHMQCM